MFNSIFLFNNSLQINFEYSALLKMANLQKQRNLCFNLIYVKQYYLQQNKIKGNAFVAQAPNDESNQSINACALNLQLKNFLKNYKYEKLINNYKEFNRYRTRTEKVKLENNIFLKAKYKMVSPGIKQQVFNQKINTLTAFLGKATYMNPNFDNDNFIKQAACIARVLKSQPFFSKQTHVFTSTSIFMFLKKKKNKLKTVHVLQNMNKTKGLVLKHNYRTYSFLQTLLAKYLETTPNTKTNLVYTSNCVSYETFLQKQGLCNFVTKSQPPQAFFFTNAYITTLKKKIQNQHVISTDQHFLFNKINTKSFLGYWLIPIAGFAFITPNIFSNSIFHMFSTPSYHGSVLSLHALPIDIDTIKIGYTVSPKILSGKTSLCSAEGLNQTDLTFLKQNDLLPFSYQSSESLIIKKTFNNLYNYIKAKTTLSKTSNKISLTTNSIPITQTIVNSQKNEIINFLRNFVTKNAQMLQPMPNYIQKKSIKNVNTQIQLSNNLMPLAVFHSLNNKFKWLHEHFLIFKNNIYSLAKPSFSFDRNKMFQGSVAPFYIVSQFKNPELYFKNMLYLRTINPLYSNLKLNNDVSFINDKKTLKILKIKIIKLNKTQKKRNNRLQLTDRLNKLKIFCGRTENISRNGFLQGINKPIISKQFKTTNFNETIIDSKPFDSYKESLNLINLILKHKIPIIYCKNILNKYNNLNKFKPMLKVNNFENKNKIILNYFLLNYEIFNTTKPLKLKYNLIKTILDVSKNKKNDLLKINHSLPNYLNSSLIKPILLDVFTNFKIISTRFEYNQNLTNNLFPSNLMPSLYKNYVTTQASNNKIIQNVRLWFYDKQGVKNNTCYKTKPFIVNKRHEIFSERAFHLSHIGKTSFLALSSKENLNSLSVLFKHQKMFKNKTEIQKQKLQIQKKRKAKKQRLETRRQKKRTRFFPRPTWLRYRMFLNIINQRKFTVVDSNIKNANKIAFSVNVFKRKNKVFKNLFLSRINFNLISLNGIKLNYIFKNFLISKNNIKNKKSVVSQIILKKNRLIKDCLNKSHEFYPFFNIPIKTFKKKHSFKKMSLRDIKMGTSYVKAIYINFKNQKTNNPPPPTEKNKDKATIFRDFWIWAYNNTLTNNINQKLWWLLPNNTSLFINYFFSDLVNLQKFSISRSNNTFIKNIKQIKNIFAIARINWALNKINYNSFTDYNRRYNLWGVQKLRNQSKNNKTKFLEKQFIDFFNKNIFLNKNLSSFYKKISNKLSQKTQKLNYITNYSYNSAYYHCLKTKNIKIFNNFFWSNLKIKTLVKNTYFLDKQQDTFLVLTSDPNIFKKLLEFTFNINPVEKNWNIMACHNVYFPANFIVPLIISCLVVLHICTLLSLVSISQVRCFIKFHLILVYKLSNVYTNLLGYVPKRYFSKVILNPKTFDFFTNTTTPTFKTNLLLFKQNQRRLLTILSFNLLKKEFKNKHKVRLNLPKLVKLKTQNLAYSNNSSNIKLFIANNLNIIYSKVNIISPKTTFLKRINVIPLQPSSLIAQTLITIKHKTTMDRKKVVRTYNINQGNFYFKKMTNLKTNRTFKFFKKTLVGTFFYMIDLFQSSIRTVSGFFEKPAEYTTTWIAFGFLVEWSSDPITIIPENVDISIWNVFSKIAREKNIQFVFNSYYGLITLFSIFNTKYQLNLFTNSYGNLNISSFPVLLTISYLLQNRIKHFFDIFMETISQSDTDLIARQGKGTLFWDIWADFLVTAADYYNINIAALSTIKAEQNALIENISNDFGTLVNPKQMKIKTIMTWLLHNKKDFKINQLKKHLISSNFYHDAFNKKKQLFMKLYFVDQIKDLTKKEETSLNNAIQMLLSPNIIFCNPKKGVTDLLNNISSNLGACAIQESKLESILANFNRWSINQYITYQSWHSHNGSNNANGDLFIDYHLPKSFSHIRAIQYNSIVQQPIGTIICQIYSGIFNQKISKNLLLVNTKTTTKQILGASPVINYNASLIHALAGETELKIVTDNAQRYALVNRGFAIGIKLLRDVFDAIALNTPCIFLLEDIHTIGERRPMLISDSGGTLTDDIGDIQLDFFGSQRDEVHEKNQVVYQLTRHAITHYKKPFRGDYSLCLTPDHDVLTTNGWIPINQVTTDHTVATFNRKTGELSYQKPTKVYHYDHKGPLYHVRNEQIDLVTTLNHRMLVRNGHIPGNSLTNYNLVPAKDIIGKRVKYLKTANWNKEDYQFVLPSVTLYLNCIEPPKIVDMEAWLTFFGLWMAEGCVTKNNIRYEVIITQKKKNAAKIIQEVIQNLGYTYNKSKFNFRVQNKQLYKYLEPLSVRAPQKQLPWWVWELSQKQARVLLEGMFLGDGSFCSSGKTRVYYTSSVKLADDVMRLALHAGWSGNKYLSVSKGTVSYIDGKKITAKYDNWSISIIKSRNNPTVNHRHSKEQGFQIEELIQYEGSVHCLSVPNETFYVRRNNLPVWTGNSIPTNLYLADLFLKLPTQSTSNLSIVENHNSTIKNKIKNQSFLNFFSSLKTSYINIIRQAKKKLAPPSTSPFSVLLLKEEKKLQPNKIVEELPWTGLPSEQLSRKPRASYSVRAKVAMLAELSLSNMAAKLDMITDLLVIIDSVRSNKGFVVFATTDIPHILDPALRRPGRLDETICLPEISNSTYSNYEIIKSICLKDSNFKAVVKQVSMGLPIPKYFSNTLSNVILHSNDVLILNHIKKSCSLEKRALLIKQCLYLRPNSICQQVSELHSTFTAQAFNKKQKNKATAYYEVGKNLLNFYLNMCLCTNQLNIKPIPLLNKIFKTTNVLNLKTINSLSLYDCNIILHSKNKIVLQLMLLFGGKIGQLLGSKNFVNTIKLQSKNAILQRASFLTFDSSKLLEAVFSPTLFGFDGECISLQVTPNENLRITTSMLLSFIYKRYLYKKNLIVPKLLSFTDGNILEEPPCPPFSSLLIPAKRFENYKRVFYDSIVSNKMGQRKAQISFIEKLQNQTQLRKIKELKNLFSDAQKSKKATQNSVQQEQLKQFGNLTTVPDENFVQTTTNINWYYQNRILKRHGYYLTNQWWNGQLSEHNVETVFLSDIDWRSSFIKNKQISTKFQQKNSSDGLDILLDFPDSDQYYNPRRRRWLLNKGDWSFWFNFDKVYSEEIVSTCILESIIETYRFLHNNTEVLDFVTCKFIVHNYYQRKTQVVHEKITYPKNDRMLQRRSSQSLNNNLVKAIPKKELKTIITNSFQRF
uniref:Cell division protein n=1 Tax=Pleodorina starrii TaxID=330485 RepID=M9P7Z9_9CHLO|nr:cell division protein [Pleodorina starrii]AFY64391.1 cell division protein [Pleodorina starrii]